MTDLKETIVGYAEYFIGHASEAYASNGALKVEEFPLPEWQAVRAAILGELESPYSQSLKTVASKKDLYVPAIEGFLTRQKVSALSFYAHGATAATFEAQVEGDKFRILVRIGPQARIDKDKEFVADFSGPKIYNRPWCPLTLQPEAKTAFVRQSYGSADRMRLALEVLSLVPLVPEKQPSGFGHFLNEYVFADTPYIVDDNKDLGILRDGTPVYVDPDSLNFKAGESVKIFKDQFRAEWQQEVMAIIAENCSKLNLPDPLNWVVQKQDGTFATKQTALYSNSFPDRPTGRRLVRLKEQTAEA